MNSLFIKNLSKKIELLLGMAVAVCLFCYIFVLAHRSIFDLDIWLHLKTGEFIAQNKYIPSRDIFSFTLQGKPWVDHEWLFQSLAYLTYSRWQADGLILLQCLIIVLSFFILFLLGHRLIKSYLAVAAILFFIADVSAIRFNIRPEIFSLFFFALYLYFLRLYIDKPGIYFLLLAQFLWVNLHGYFFLGPLLVFLFVLGEFLRRRLKYLPWQWREEFVLSDAAYQRLKRLFLLILLACFLNPGGFRQAIYPFHIFKEIFSNRAQIFFRYIQELQPTFQFFKTPPINAYSIMVIFCLGLMLMNIKKLKLIEIILFIFFFFFSFSIRNIAFFSFICYAIIISCLIQTTNRISHNFKIQVSSQWAFYLKVVRQGVEIVFILCLGYKINSTMNKVYYDFASREAKSYLSGIEYSRYPQKAVDFILENDTAPNLLNDFNSGAYLIGRAYPKIKVFIDGRTELYGQEFFKDYQAIMEGDKSLFEKIIGRHNINAILFSLTSYSAPLEIISYIYKSSKWKLVFFDEYGIVFLRDTPANKKLISRYKIALDTYTVPNADLESLGLRRVYPEPYIKRAWLFNKLGEYDLVIAESKEALRIMPNCFEAQHFLGKAYLGKKLYNEAFAYLRNTVLMSPRDVEALTDLGHCWVKLRETKSAINILKKAIRSNKRYAPAYYHLGNAYLTENKETEAVEVLYKATKYAPDVAAYRFKLAQALNKKGKKLKDNLSLVEARKELRRALQLAGKNN